MKNLLNNKLVNRKLTHFFVWLYNFSYAMIASLAVRANLGIHPKHRILKYHKFFSSKIQKNTTVVDIGCGKGLNAFEISKSAKKVVGIDINLKSIDFAKKHYQRKNLEFINADLLKFNFEEKFDYIVLSNVLEHVEKRVAFLKKLHDVGKTILIRVPMIDRDWLPVYLRSIGEDYRLDKTHFTEYTLSQLLEELRESNWKLKEYSIQFGEIWGVIS